MLEEKQRIVGVLRLGFEADRLPQESECRATVSRKVLDARHCRWHLDPPIGLVARRRHRSRLLLSAVLVWRFEVPVLRAGFALEDPTLLPPFSLSFSSARSFPLDQCMVKYFYDIVKRFYQIVNRGFPANGRSNGHKRALGGGAPDLQPTTTRALRGLPKEDTRRVGRCWLR